MTTDWQSTPQVRVRVGVKVEVKVKASVRLRLGGDNRLAVSPEIFAC